MASLTSSASTTPNVRTEFSGWPRPSIGPHSKQHSPGRSTMTTLEGRVAIVTGAGRGLGRSHALELARHGAAVGVNDLGVGLAGEHEEGGSPAESVVAEIEAFGGTAMADGTSVTDWSGIEALVTRVLQRYRRLDAVVNNAGFLRDRMLTSMTEA